MAAGPHLWLTVGMILLGGALHYLGPVPFYDEDGPVQLTRHAMHRVLFMVPVAYAAFIFGPRCGFATLAIVTLVMLPRALFISASPPDAVLEVTSTVLVSGLIILWFAGQQKEKERRLEILQRLELARRELASQVEVIRKSERRLATINDVCCAVGESLDLPQVLRRILEKAVDALGVAAAMIFLKDESGAKLELVAHKGISPELAATLATLKVGEGFNGRVAALGEPIEVENSLLDPRLSVPEVPREGIRSQLIVPLRSKGQIIGSLCVATATNRRFTPDDRELIAAIGSQVGIAIENARLYQKALNSEERYRDLFENATLAILVQNLDGVITAANKACSTLTGYSTEELVGAGIDRLFAPRASAGLMAYQEELLRGEGGVHPYDIPMVRKDGTELILSMTTRLVSEDGQPRGFQHIAIDVTERRRMRDTLNYYMHRVLTAQEEERKRISRELHDETAQSLLLLLQMMDSISDGAGGKRSHPYERQLEQLRTVVLQTLADLRRLTRDLRPQILDDLGLVAAVEWLAEEMEGQSGIKTEVVSIGSHRSLPPDTQLLLFRIAQEALSNVRRHSTASETRVVLEFDDGRVRLAVEDNGQGFPVPSSMSELAGTGKLGILGMFERARLAGGSLTVESQPGAGTRIAAELPA